MGGRCDEGSCDDGRCYEEGGDRGTRTRSTITLFLRESDVPRGR